MTSRTVALLAIASAAIACGSRQSATQQAAATVSPEVSPEPVGVCGELACPWLREPGACQRAAEELSLTGTFLEAVILDPLPGTTTVTANGGTFGISLDENLLVMDWFATRPVDFVVAQGAWGGNAYVYPSPVLGDTELESFLQQPVTGATFCVSEAPPPLAALEVAKTASASFERSFAWTIAKTSPTSSLVLPVGQSQLVPYTVTLNATPIDADWVVTGTITIHNPTSAAAIGVAIEDTFGGASVTPDCGGFDGNLAPGATVECTYAIPLGAALDATNVATVTTQEGPIGATATAAVAFGAPATVVDDCVTVSDVPAGPLGTACSSESPKSFSYSLTVGPFTACDAGGEGQDFFNTASFAAPSGATGSASWAVQVTVPCTGGCTLTQGYWKTHGVHGPAPFDDAWLLVGPAADDTAFAISGLSYHEALVTAVRGNAWFLLAHQYIAARMNVLSGADPTAVASELAWAEAFFAVHTPDYRYRPSMAKVMTETASTLDRYNNGLIGPGHCE